MVGEDSEVVVLEVVVEGEVVVGKGSDVVVLGVVVEEVVVGKDSEAVVVGVVEDVEVVVSKVNVNGSSVVTSGGLNVDG